MEFTKTYAHNGDDFLGLETENGFMNIRWSSVVGYIVPSRAKLGDLVEQYTANVGPSDSGA
jgi:hypothetical protein